VLSAADSTGTRRTESQGRIRDLEDVWLLGGHEPDVGGHARNEQKAVPPALWLLVFGEVFTKVRAIPTGGLRYLDFMAPGILLQSVLFIAIFYGIAVILERDLGIVHKLLATPTPRAALVLGNGLSAGIRGPGRGRSSSTCSPCCSVCRCTG
jgi:hypothetical protein